VCGGGCAVRDTVSVPSRSYMHDTTQQAVGTVRDG